jgi:ADP-heptose:LPS heptosyltransferase
MSDQAWAGARRVLAVRLDNLGDVLLMTPALRAIKRSSREVHLALWTSAVGAQVARLDRDIDEVIVRPAPWVDPWRRLEQSRSRELATIEELRVRGFDAAVIFTSFRQSPLPAAYACYLADIPLRLGATWDGAGSLLTSRYRPPDGVRHEVERALELVGEVGFETNDRRLALDVPDEARRDATALVRALGGRGPNVVVHPGCTMPARTYPAELFARSIEAIVSELGATVFVTGSHEERELVEGVCTQIGEDQRRRVYPLAGVVSFEMFAALLGASDLVVTNNTGPMHVAAAVGTPVVALFALTNPPEQWRPWGVAHRLLYKDVPCRLCYARICPFAQECLRGVTPREVVAAAAELIGAEVRAA